MPLPIDYTVSKIIDEIFNSLDGKVAKQTIQAVIDFQSLTIRQGIEDGDNIHIKRLGKFVFNHKRAFKVQEGGIQKSMQVVQEIVRTEGSKSYKIKEIKRIVFKKS